MPFQNDKKVFLAKEDKSKKGHIDRNIGKLVELINKNPSYYTTSSCSGRIVLLKLGKLNRKYKAEWLFASHEKVNFSQLKKALSRTRLPKEAVWFLQEGAILHVRCKTLEDTVAFLNRAKAAGFKHSGISSFGKKIIVEVIDTERIEAPVSRDGKPLAEDPYLKFLAQESNDKLGKTIKKIKRLEKILKK